MDFTLIFLGCSIHVSAAGYAFANRHSEKCRWCHELYELMFVLSVTAWFTGGAILFQPCIRWPQPITNPDVNICIIYNTIMDEKNNIDWFLKSSISIEVGDLLTLRKEDI